MALNSSQKAYSLAIDFHAQDTQVFIADRLTSDGLAKVINTQDEKAFHVSSVKETSVPQAVINKFSYNSPQAAYYMARDAFNSAVLAPSKRHKIALAVTGGEAGADKTIYMALAVASSNKTSTPDIYVYSYTAASMDAENAADIVDTIGDGVKAGVDILFSVASCYKIPQSNVNAVTRSSHAQPMPEAKISV